MIKTIFITLVLLTVTDLTLTAVALQIPSATERNPLYPHVGFVGLTLLNFIALALVVGLSQLYLRISEGCGKSVLYSILVFCVVSRSVVVTADLFTRVSVFFKIM